jgi:NAD(P)-dependent dehydrogenase (short-subunit alcohol dehydrogenase family)
MNTQSKIVLVTGGSRGLGKNMSEQLALKGLDVILTYQTRKEEALATVKEIEKSGQKAAALPLDIGNLKTFDGFFSDLSRILKEKFQTDRIDFLVNNAGIGIHALFSGTTEEQFDQLQLIHFKGPYFFTQQCLNWLRNGGGIVNISTGLVRFSFAGYSAYAAMKGAMDTLTRYQAKELGERGIRANSVAPGAIETDFGGGRVRDNAELNKLVASQTALGRVGLPDDIGSVVAFLCTDDAKWINAQKIEVTGGMLI